MAAPKTEVILSPKVDRSDLREVKERMNNAFDDVSRKSEKELENATRRGTEKGIRTGGGEGLKYLKRGLVGLAAAVGAAAVGALSGLDNDIERMIGRLDLVNNLTREAAAFSVDAGELAQMYAIFNSLGYSQQQAANMLNNFQSALNRPEMEYFGGIAEQAGVVQAALAFISGARDKTGAERSQYLETGFSREGALIAAAIAGNVGENTNLQALFQAMTGQTVTADALTQQVAKADAETLEVSKYGAGVYIRDLQKAASDNADQVIQYQENIRNLENAKDRLIDRKLQIQDLQITAQIAQVEATEATITGFSNVIGDLETLIAGQRTARDLELTQKVATGDATGGEIGESIARQTIISLGAQVDKIVQFLDFWSDSNDKQDFSNNGN